MSATLPELSPIPLPEEKPSNRGKFSLDRNYWEQLHHNRYTKWQLGTSAEDIVSEEGVSSNAIRHSLAWVEARLTGAQVVEGRNTRLRLRTFAQLSEKYVEELEKLMGDANPIIRSRALEHFRKTLGLEANGGVRVNIHNQQAAVFGQQQPQSFEEAMDGFANCICARTSHLPRFRSPADHARSIKPGNNRPGWDCRIENP